MARAVKDVKAEMATLEAEITGHKQTLSEAAKAKRECEQRLVLLKDQLIDALLNEQQPKK